MEMTAREKLTKALDLPLKHISAIRRCFNLCSNEDDVEEVIGMIPNKFGSWSVDYSDDGETFTVYNTFVENGEQYTEYAEYGFCKDEEEA